jgi:hypothetical protein
MTPEATLPEEALTLSSPQWLAPLTRMGERVAVLEEKFSGLKGDTEMIRSNIHSINNTLQVAVGTDRELSAGVKSLAEGQSAHAEAMKELAVSVAVLTSKKDQMLGVWWAIVRVCAVVVGAFTLIGSVGAAVMWFLENHIHLTVSG